jgi:DNA-binding response OmpR family regulator
MTASSFDAAAPAARILVAEDEAAIAEGLALNLGLKGYDVAVAADGRHALDKLEREAWDLVILDVRLPEVDGFEVCQQLRARRDFTPVLILTARSQPDDVVYGLKLGADDYVTKPFDLAELLARVEVLLRRHRWAREDDEDEGEPPPRIEFGPFWVDFSTWEAQTRDGVRRLSRKEVAVLQVLTSRPNQVVSRRELLAEVWQLPHHPNTRVVDNVIVALRKHFEESPWRPRHIQSVRGVGYRFVP